MGKGVPAAERPFLLDLVRCGLTAVAMTWCRLRHRLHLGDAVLKTIFKALAYLYVAVALAPLVLLAIGLSISLAGGGSSWPFLPFGRPATVESQPVKEEITFRTGPLLVAGNISEGTARYAIGVGQASSPTRPQDVVPRIPVDTYYVVATDVEYAGGTASQAGEFNNILIQQKIGAAPTKVFDRRVSVKFFAGIETPAGAALVILATDKDTNKDGKINPKDMHGVYLHMLDGAAPREISGVPGNVAAVDMVSQPGALIVRAVLDTNGDGSAAKVLAVPYGPYAPFAEEPQRVYRIDLKTLEATPLVAPATIDELQKALDAAARPK